MFIRIIRDKLILSN